MIRILAILATLAALTLPARAATDIEVFETPGGVTVWFVNEPTIPIVSLQISFRGGTSLDPAGKEGVTNLMMGLLEEGAGTLSDREFARRQDELAARFYYTAQRDTVSVDAEILTENLDAAIDLLRLAIQEPRFDQEPLDRTRAQVLASIEGSTTDPGDIARTRFREISFPDHPYSIRRSGTPEAVAGLTREDIAAAHQAALVRNRVYVGAVGDISKEKLGEVVDRLLDGLPEDGPDLPAQIDMAVPGGTTVIEMDVQQSVAIFGHTGILRDDPDFLPAYVVTEILGGSGADSRLRNEVREKRGLTYGIGAYLAPSSSSGQIVGNFSSSNDSMAEALDIVRSEWESIATKGITEEELEAAKLFLTGAYPLRFDSNVRIARTLVGLQLAGLSPDYVKTRNDQIMALTLDEVNRVAQRIFDPGALHFVVVGQPEGLLATE